MRSALIGLGILAMSSLALANAPESEEVPNEIEAGIDVQSGVPYRLFRAEGTHICWSSKMIGNTCFVHGTNYTDCLQAYNSLKSWDCCRNSGQNSVNFVMSKCTNWN